MMSARRVAWVASALVLLSVPGRADTYFLHTRNEDLRSQAAGQPERLVPDPKYFSFVADAYLYKPWGDTAFYYHGNGYWVNLFAEARPLEDVSLNLKLSPYDGASSYGYSGTRLYTNF